MTDKIFTYIFRLLNQETAMLMSKYDSQIDDDLLNNLHADMLLEVGDNEVQGFINYIIKLIAFCEAKEDYEKCAMLLKLKNKIKNYNNDQS